MLIAELDIIELMNATKFSTFYRQYPFYGAVCRADPGTLVANAKNNAYEIKKLLYGYEYLTPKDLRAIKCFDPNAYEEIIDAVNSGALAQATEEVCLVHYNMYSGMELLTFKELRAKYKITQADIFRCQNCHSVDMISRNFDFVEPKDSDVVYFYMIKPLSELIEIVIATQIPLDTVGYLINSEGKKQYVNMPEVEHGNGDYLICEFNKKNKMHDSTLPEKYTIVNGSAFRAEHSTEKTAQKLDLYCPYDVKLYKSHQELLDRCEGLTTIADSDTTSLF